MSTNCEIRDQYTRDPKASTLLVRASETLRKQTRAVVQKHVLILELVTVLNKRAAPARPPQRVRARERDDIAVCETTRHKSCPKILDGVARTRQESLGILTFRRNATKRHGDVRASSGAHGDSAGDSDSVAPREATLRLNGRQGVDGALKTKVLGA
jgi:hypothetical protein